MFSDSRWYLFEDSDSMLDEPIFRLLPIEKRLNALGVKGAKKRLCWCNKCSKVTTALGDYSNKVHVSKSINPSKFNLNTNQSNKTPRQDSERNKNEKKAT